MNKSLLFLLFLVSFTMTASAQMVCGFDNKMDDLKKENPGFVQQLDQTEQYIRNFIATHPAGTNKKSAIYTIPVVVHVMNTGGAIGSIYNPSDAQIINTIDYINQIYAGTYAGMEAPVEGGGVVNMELRFELAKRTPACGYTNGIERVDASSIPNYVANGMNLRNSDGVGEVGLKNYSRWNPADYYNIWVVNKIDGKDGTQGQFTAGFAYFAGAPPNLDGTVMLATQMKPGAKTLPHELGHAFNLYHTFQGSNLNTSCPTNVDCLNEGDRVCDTDPVSNNVNSSGSNDFRCRTGVNTCNSLNYTRNTESNFMAYTNCHTLFTYGQKARVQAAMTLPGRASLIASLGATSCGTVLNFSNSSDKKTEDNTGTTSGCRTYKDYEYLMNIGAAANAPATVTLSYSGTAIKGLDYDLTTNGSFSSPDNVLTFAAGNTSPQPFIIRVYDDANVESAETVIIDYAVNTSGDAIKGTLNTTFTFTINDNDFAPVVANTNTYQVGTAITSSITNPFNAANLKQRGQLLYKVSELLAAGITKGPITSMQLYISRKNSTGNFNNFTIKMGSGSSDYLYEGAADFGTGLITVHNTASLSTIEGWNTFTFSTPYEWDGISNLVVEYCYSSASGTGSDLVGGYRDGGTASQSNFIFSTGIDCAVEFSSFSLYGNGTKPSVKFGLNHPATEVETTTSGTHTEHLSVGSNDYFYSNSNKIIAKIGNLDAEAGCVEVAVENAGTAWKSFLSGKRSAKIFSVTPVTNGSMTSYSISLYFTEAELDGKAPGSLMIAKTSAATISEANSENTITAIPVVTNLGDNSVFTATFTGFSRFFLVDNDVLPVTLISFTGKMNDQSEADLSWKVSEQQNLNRFEVEHSIDGQVYTAIKAVAAMKGNAATYDYYFTDKKVSKGLNYYRLKMIDNDGKFRYSLIIRIINNSSGQFVTLMNNPVFQTIDILVNNNRLAPISAVLYNATGAKVALWQLGTGTGKIQLPLGRYHLSSGVYVLKVSDGNQIETLKVLKK